MAELDGSEMTYKKESKEAIRDATPANMIVTLVNRLPVPLGLWSPDILMRFQIESGCNQEIVPSMTCHRSLHKP